MSSQGFRRQLQRAMMVAGWGFAYAAIIAVAWEAFISIKAARYVMISAGEQWQQVHGASLAAFQEYVAVQLPSLIAGPLSDLLLNWPAWTLYGGAGLLLLGLGRLGRAAETGGRRRRRPVQDLGWHGPSFR